jgi:uncharacterized protein involved in response to NO
LLLIAAFADASLVSLAVDLSRVRSTAGLVGLGAMAASVVAAMFTQRIGRDGRQKISQNMAREE